MVAPQDDEDHHKTKKHHDGDHDDGDEASDVSDYTYHPTDVTKLTGELGNAKYCVCSEGRGYQGIEMCRGMRQTTVVGCG